MNNALKLLAVLLAVAPAQAQQPVPMAKIEADIAVGKLGKIVSVVVEQHGKTVYAKSFGKTPAGELHDIRSAGKSITALAIGAAIADGKLGSVDVKVWPLLGIQANDARSDISIRDLLTMSSALDCNDRDPKSPGQEEKMYQTSKWRNFAMKLPTDQKYARGTDGFGRWSYCTAGVFLLGQVVEAATGERFDAYVGRRIFAPLGITAVEWRRSPSDEIQSGGQVKMRSADLAKIGRLVLDDGRWQGQQLILESWIKSMRHPHRQVGQYIHYGYLWWFNLVPSPSGPQPSWMMQGNGGNIVAIFRDYDAVVVVQAASYNKDDAFPNSFKIVEAALASLPAPPAKR